MAEKRIMVYGQAVAFDTATGRMIIDVPDLAVGAATEAKQDDILAKMSGDPATETTLGDIKAKTDNLTNDPSTATLQNDVKTATEAAQDVLEAAVDGITTALRVVDYAHHEIHSGSSFLCSYTGVVADGTEIALLIVTPDTAEYAHMTFDIGSTGETDVYLYKDTGFTGGTAIPTIINHNQNSQHANTTSITHSPSGSGNGTLMVSAMIGLDTGGGATRRLSGGSSGGRNEIVLERNTPYLLRVASGTDGNRVSILIDWYEHTDTPS